MKHELFTSKQVATILHYTTETTVIKLARAHNIGRKLGWMWFFTKSDIKNIEELGKKNPRRKKNFFKKQLEASS